MSFVFEAKWNWFLLQVEVADGGFFARRPRFIAESARIGASVGTSSARGYATSGAAYVSMSGKSGFECMDFGCDPREGSGVAFVSEVGGSFRPFEEGAIEPFLQLLVPTFAVTQTIYPGDQPATVPMLLLGVRALL